MKHAVRIHFWIERLSSSSFFRKSCGFMCFTIFFFFTSTAPALAQAIPLSPAGGGYLVLDGRDDYASIDFEKHGALFKEGTNTLTVEAWVYPTSVPVVDKQATILAQQLVFFTVPVNSPWFRFGDPGRGNDLFLVARTYIRRGWGAIVLPLSSHEWHHIAFQTSENERTLICDGRSESYPGGWIPEHNVPGISLLEREDFVVGGYGGKRQPPDLMLEVWGSFEGYIDEVRISDIARYDTGKRDFSPEDAFEPDANTIALWHFERGRSAGVFQDSSGNDYHLVGENGATLGGRPLSVNGMGKLAATWGTIRTDGDR